MGENASWNSFKEAILLRFGSAYDDPMAEIKNLRQVGNIEEYQNAFDKLNSRVDLPKEQQISFYIAGLQKEIELAVRMFRPKTLAEVYNLSKIQDAALKLNKQSVVVKQTPAPNTTLAAKSSFNTPYPKRQLTQKEFQERRAKNLCFYCDEKYTPGNSCRGQVFNLEVVADSVDTSQDDSFLETGEDLLQEEGTGEIIEFTPQISLHALNGVESFQTMRVIGHVGKQSLHILIDTGSTHNFLDLDKAKKLGCTFSSTCPLKVDIPGGAQLISKNLCKKFAWKMHGEDFVDGIQIQGKESSLKRYKEIRSAMDGRILRGGLSRHPPPHEDAIEEMVKELLESGVIRPSQSPFSSPVVMVKKKDGTWRMCIDYRRLNEQTIKDKFPIPIIEELIDELQVMPFGLTNAPSTFQALMNSVFKKYLRKFVLVFFDDILVYSPDLRSHVEHLELMTLKIEAMKQWPIPTNLKKLRGFLGLTGYYRRFIRDYALISQPLTKLLKKNAFVWSNEAQSAFVQLKEAMMNAPVLKLPNFEEVFIVETDASGEGIGAVLQQSGHPIAYFSKTLAPRHHSLSTYEKELLAVIQALHKWRGYLLDRHFIIKTDHFSLKYLLEQRITTPAQMKWLPKLMGFDYEIMYKKGSENGAADALSRVNTGEEKESGISGQYHDLAASCCYPHFHYDSNGGHSGIEATIQRIQGFCYWKKLRKQVKEFVSKCTVCQRSKPDLCAYPGLLQPLPIPTLIWSDISMDFIEGLPNSGGKTVIMVVVDRPKEWAKWLALAEYWYNTNYHTAINTTPFEAVYGQPPSSPILYSPGQSKRAQARMKVVADSHRTERSFDIVAKMGMVAEQLFKGDPLSVQAVLPKCDPNGHLACVPIKVLDRKMIKVDIRLLFYVLIQWFSWSQDDATWSLGLGWARVSSKNGCKVAAGALLPPTSAWVAHLANPTERLKDIPPKTRDMVTAEIPCRKVLDDKERKKRKAEAKVAANVVGVDIQAERVAGNKDAGKEASVGVLRDESVIPEPCALTCGRLMEVERKLVLVAGMGRRDRPGVIKGIGIWVLDGKEWTEITRMPHKYAHGFGDLDDVFARSIRMSLR
ncbi:putative mitochondrial protein [Tanacetum coccineum]|uniref:Mitochondrial protein n=1 Tax=Tanacetum coccineum TaxID=301880 RepID=A0ABQ5HT39_9ASTR